MDSQKNAFFNPELAAELAARLGWGWHFAAQTGSTNDDAKQWAQTHEVCCPQLFVALHQTAGRGVHHKTWDDEGASLLFSLLYQPSSMPDWRWISIAAGMSAASTLTQFGVNAKLKWPNDIWIDGKKAGGILCEQVKTQALPNVVIGIGLNWVAPEGLTTHGWKKGGCFSPTMMPDGQTCTLFLMQLVQDLLLNPTRDTTWFYQRWPQFDAFLNQVIHVQTGSRVISGQCLGITPQAQLRVLGSQGELVFDSASIIASV